MICPKCGGKTTVTDCARNTRMVIRRRKCRHCGRLYFTEERFIEAQDGRTAERLWPYYERRHGNEVTTKQYLSQAIQLDRRIRAKRADIKHQRDLACSVSASPKDVVCKPGAGDPVGRAAARIADLEAELDADVKRYTELHREIAAVIDSVPDARYVELLTRRYLCGEKWEKIAVGMNYSCRRVLQLHDLALQAVEGRLH